MREQRRGVCNMAVSSPLTPSLLSLDRSSAITANSNAAFHHQQHRQQQQQLQQQLQHPGSQAAGGFGLSPFSTSLGPTSLGSSALGPTCSQILRSPLSPSSSSSGFSSSASVAGSVGSVTSVTTSPSSGSEDNRRRRGKTCRFVVVIPLNECCLSVCPSVGRSVKRFFELRNFSVYGCKRLANNQQQCNSFKTSGREQATVRRGGSGHWR